MQVKKGELQIYMEFLNGLKLKGKASLGRTKISGSFRKQLEDYSKDQVEIIDELDAWKSKEEGLYDKSNKELSEALTILASDDVEVEFHTPFKKYFVEALENYDEELSGVSAEVYANLYEKLIEEKENE